MRLEICEKKIFKKMIKSLFNNNMKNDVNGISIDSRKIKENDVFIPLVGKNYNGHDYICNAIDNGASLIFSEIFYKTKSTNIINVVSNVNTLRLMSSYWREKINGTIIGITGSNGKTTTKDLIYHILSKNNKCEYSLGNYNSTIGLPLSLLSMNIDADYYVLELGTNSPGEISYLSNIIEPQIGVITNISESHIENFETIENIKNEKISLFNNLPSKGIAFINIDDPFISTYSSNIKKISYSLNSNADFIGHVNNYNNKMNIKINEYESITIPYISNKMAQNILCAFSITSYLGISDKQIRDSIENFTIPEGRGKVINLNNYTIIDDSYNSNPVSAKEGITEFSKFKIKKRKIAVIGDMLELGLNSKLYHQNLGKHILKCNIDIVFGYGELTKHVIKVMKKNGIRSYHFHSKNKLTTKLINILEKDDIIYFKGSRGMNLEKIIYKVFNI